MKNASPARMLLGLRIHAAAFVGTIIVLLAVNVMVGPPYWVGSVLLGWGIGLISHWLSVRYHTSHRTDPS